MTKVRISRLPVRPLLLVLALGTFACGQSADSEPPPGVLPFTGTNPTLPAAANEPAESLPSDASGDTAEEEVYTVETFSSVEDFDRESGMPIGQDPDAQPIDEEDDTEAPSTDPSSPQSNDDLEIPTFVLEDEAPPCSGCIELSLLLDSPNQDAFFSFNAGGVNTTRVVWNLVIPSNEDQVFIRTTVNGQDGPYQQLLANDFPNVGVAFEYEHRDGGGPWTGNANEIGIRLGSSGGWARNERVKLFVESIVLEGSNGSADRTFNGSAEGVQAQTTAQQPQVIFHP